MNPILACLETFEKQEQQDLLSVNIYQKGKVKLAVERLSNMSNMSPKDQITVKTMKEKYNEGLILP